MADRAILIDHDYQGTNRARNLAAPLLAGDAATKGYVDSAVEGLAWKDSARVATQANINLASPGATIDGITLAASDRVLVRAQTTGSENGIYVWNGAAVAMTRAPDGSTFDELEQAVVTVEEGTSAGATYRQTAINGTLGTTPVAWASFGTAAGAATESAAGIAEIATQAETDAGTDDARIVTPAKLAAWSGRLRRFAQTFGDGSATSYAVTHNLGTRDLHVQVFLASGSYDLVDCEVELTSTNQVTIKLNAAPASNALRAVIMG